MIKTLKQLTKAILIAVVPVRFILWRKNNRKNSVALTFDDGPNPEFTPKLLAVLKEKNIKASFFLVGENIEKYPEVVKQIYAEGHDIGNHGYSHQYMTQLKKHELRNEIIKTSECLANLGIECRLFRPPYGEIRYKFLPTIWKMGFTIVMWSIDTRDFESKSAADVIERVERAGMRSGDLLLLHDESDVTIEAVRTICDNAIANGLEFVRASEMLTPGS